MTQAISQFFSTVFGDNVILATILIAMLPLIELKGAIPFAVSRAFWGNAALSVWQAFGYSLLGSCLIVPIWALIFLPFYKWIKNKKFFGKVANFFAGSAIDKSDKVNATTTSVGYKSILKKMFITCVFVAFPVPLTGVWTGTCLGLLLGLNYWQTLVSVIFGNVICGLIVAGVCMVFPNATNIILYIFLALVICLFIYKLIAHFIKQKKQKELNKNTDQQ